jgi:hypothetical protein
MSIIIEFPNPEKERVIQVEKPFTTPNKKIRKETPLDKLWVR